MSLSPTIPVICVSPAPAQEVFPEPFSPFSPKSFTFAPEVEGNRPTHLTPPATSISFKRNLSLSPLRPPDSPITGKGLERQRFEALLQASRERNASVGHKRSLDLRKDVALKAHNRKTLERRAIFLSKVLAPPSPSATDLPKTPPESPAIFHYTLPSPGLVSPLALFETYASENPADPNARQSWVEQVDFRLPLEEWSKIKTKVSPKAALNALHPTHRKLPSLDEITARMAIEKAEAPISPPKADRLPAFLQRKNTPVVAPVVEKLVEAPVAAPVERANRLPAFLRRNAIAEKPAEKVLAPIVIPAAAPVAEEPTTIRIGRLQMPIRRRSPTTPTIAVTPASPEVAQDKSIPYVQPRSPLSPKLQITTTIVSRSSAISPIELSSGNLDWFNQKREARSKDMLLKLSKRRGLSISLPKKGIENLEPGSPGSPVSPGGTKKSRRMSSPADLPLRKRNGFESSVLSIPGAF